MSSQRDVSKRQLACTSEVLEGILMDTDQFGRFCGPDDGGQAGEKLGAVGVPGASGHAVSGEEMCVGGRKTEKARVRTHMPKHPKKLGFSAGFGSQALGAQGQGCGGFESGDCPPVSRFDGYPLGCLAVRRFSTSTLLIS